MNESIKNRLSEVLGANNISYILKENNDFSITGYKVMQNQRGAGLLRCSKIMYNGKVKLVYIVGNNKPLFYVAARLGVNELGVIVYNLIQRVNDIRLNGFFRAENLELDFEKIFVDTTDYSVHLIYFPLSGADSGKISVFENEFRMSLVSFLDSFPVFGAPQFQRLRNNLLNGALPVETILKELRETISGSDSPQKRYLVDGVDAVKQEREKIGEHLFKKEPGSNDSVYPSVVGHNTNNRPAQQPTMKITAINSPSPIELVINCAEYKIGKNSAMVDGVILHNPAISRIHCKISYVLGKYYVTDMGSANGTFVNNQKIESQQTVEIHNGDNLKLANSKFVVSY